MPRKADWSHKLTAIIAQLNTRSEDTLDRAAIEKLFGVSPRQALRLLQKLGAERSGGALVIPRQLLRKRLVQWCKGDEVIFECVRRQQLIRKLEESREELRMRRIAIPPPAPLGLPDGIRLENGELQVRFSGAEELLQKLMVLAQAISADWDCFQRTGVLRKPLDVGVFSTTG